MKDLIFSLPKTRQAKYLRLAEGLRLAIRAGRLKPGDVLPSSRELARRYGFHRHTVMEALAELAAEGWVEAEEKRHYRVVASLPTTFLQPPEELPVALRRSPQRPRIARPLALGDFPVQGPFRHAFPSGFPDLRLFPMREFKSHLHEALHCRDLLAYGNPRGQERLISQVEIYLRRMRGLDGREIIITNGSQEGIFLLAQLLIRPGDAVAVEALGYPPALEALRFAGAGLVGVPVDADGLDVEELERILRRRKIRLLYLTPLHQYPTTATLSAERRLRLYELAYKYNLLLLEDDYDHEFHYTSQPVAPLASFDPAGIVAYVSTFSKILFPSARVGFLALPPAIAREMAKLKRISSRQNEPLLQEGIARWMEDGGFERHLRRMRRAYAERLAHLENALGDAMALKPGLSWRGPGGGMALWLNTGRNSSSIAERALRAGVKVNPEKSYRLDQRDGTHLRLGFTGQTPGENLAGLKALLPFL